jgi:hypothetical protein
LLKTDPAKYEKEYSSYLKDVRSLCGKIMTWIGPEKKRALTSARSTITNIKSNIQSKILPSRAYYEYRLQKLIDENPKYAEVLQILKGKSFDEVNRLVSGYASVDEETLSDSLKEKVRSLPYRHPSIRFIGITKDQYKRYKTASKKNSAKKHRTAIQVNAHTMVSTAEYIVQKHKESVDKKSWNALVCAVALLTGRRSIEVTKIGKFQRSERENHLLFSGHAKIRYRPDIAHDIPLIGSNQDHVLQAVKTIREFRSFEDKTNKEVNNTTAAGLNMAVRKYFRNPRIDVHSLRTVYSAFASKYFYPLEPEGKPSEPMYIAWILGHDPDDTNTQVDYKRFNILWDKADKIIDLDEQNKKSAVEAMKQLAELIDEARPELIAMQKRGKKAYEELADWLTSELRAGRFVPKTSMERDPETLQSRRSRKTVDNFLGALDLKKLGLKAWPRLEKDLPGVN